MQKLTNIFSLLKQGKSRRIIGYQLLTICAKPLDTILSWFVQTPLYEKTYEDPIFIVGTPRSGSTILYQFLSLVLDITYTTNKWALFPRSFPLFPSNFSHQPINEFENHYGNGKHLMSIQEGGNIFDIWFASTGNHYCDRLSRQRLQAFRAYFHKISAISKKKCLLKNTRNSLRLKVIKQAFPNAKFIFVIRDLRYVSQSMLEGRKFLYGSYDKNFTVVPKEWNQFSHLSNPAQVASQAYFIEKQIRDDLKDVDESRIFQVQYRDFCCRPFEISKLIAHKFSVDLRTDIPQSLVDKKFEASESIKIEAEIMREIDKKLEDITRLDIKEDKKMPHN